MPHPRARVPGCSGAPPVGSPACRAGRRPLRPRRPKPASPVAGPFRAYPVGFGAQALGPPFALPLPGLVRRAHAAPGSGPAPCCGLRFVVLVPFRLRPGLFPRLHPPRVPPYSCGFAPAPGSRCGFSRGGALADFGFPPAALPARRPAAVSPPPAAAVFPPPAAAVFPPPPPSRFRSAGMGAPSASFHSRSRIPPRPAGPPACNENNACCAQETKSGSRDFLTTSIFSGLYL
jgi:hypothetical protein